MLIPIDVDMQMKRFLLSLRQFFLTNRRTYVNKFVDQYLEGAGPVTQQKAKVGLLPGGLLHPTPCDVARVLKTKDSLGSHLNCIEPLLHHLKPALCEYTLGCITLGPEVIMSYAHFLIIKSHSYDTLSQFLAYAKSP